MSVIKINYQSVYTITLRYKNTEYTILSTDIDLSEEEKLFVENWVHGGLRLAENELERIKTSLENKVYTHLGAIKPIQYRTTKFSEKEQNEIIENNNIYHLYELSQNEHISIDTAKQLLRCGDDIITNNLSQNPSMNTILLVNVVINNDYALNVASNTATLDYLLRILALSYSVCVREKVLENKNCPADLRLELEQDREIQELRDRRKQGKEQFDF